LSTYIRSISLVCKWDSRFGHHFHWQDCSCP